MAQPPRRLARAGLCAAALLALAGCSNRLSREDRFTGAVTPEGACGRESRGTLMVAGGKFDFAPDDGVLVVEGNVGPDGTVAGQLATIGADKKPFVMALTARIAGEQVTGTYTTPRCRFAVAFTKVHPDLF